MKLTKEQFKNVGRIGARKSYLDLGFDLPPIVLINSSDGDVTTHTFEDVSGSDVRNKLEALLYVNDAISYIFICKAQATEFIDRARELNDIESLAPEDRMTILCLSYIENNRSPENEFAEIYDEELSDWKVENIEFLGDTLIKEW